MRLMRLIPVLLVGLFACATPAEAHVVAGVGPDRWAWNFEPWLMTSLELTALWYALGIVRMRREGVHHVASAPRVIAFAAGMLVLFIALASPIDTIGAELFSVHMVQHLLLMLAAPPLLVCSRPALVFLWAFPRETRKKIGRRWSAAGLTRVFEALMHPLLVWTAFTGLFVFWHIPAAYAWALGDDRVHSVEHLCFFVSALAFWTIVIEPSGRRRLGYGATLLFVATTAVLSGLPGALMILTPRALYPVHAEGAALWGLTLMEDQQLAGLVMWIPAGFAYVAIIAWLFVRWLADAERRVSARQAALPAVFLLALLLAGCGEEAGGASAAEVGGDARRGAALVQQYGCGSCHIIPGVGGATGLVGPPLIKMGRRVYIAGVLRNSPDNLTAWLEHPQQFVPGNAMPDMGIDRKDARDLAAYLYTLR
jgi:cytochrome c oxidase assembly factor CtaG/cytochrome c2